MFLGNKWPDQLTHSGKGISAAVWRLDQRKWKDKGRHRENSGKAPRWSRKNDDILTLDRVAEELKSGRFEYFGSQLDKKNS